MLTQKTIEATFSFPEFVTACIKSVYTINSFLGYSQTTVATTIFDHAHLKNIHLIFINLFQHANNWAILSISSGDAADLKILQSDWLRAFWSISQELDFLHIWNLYRNTGNNINFHYGKKNFQKKIVTRFPTKLKKLGEC